jgi:hypothetical protein
VTEDQRNVVGRRRVFFIGGFDPRRAQGYYRRIGKAQRAFGKVGPLERFGPYSEGWRFVGAALPHAQIAFEILNWNDIVEAHWRSKGRLGAMVAAMRSLVIYSRSGLLARAREDARAVRRALLIVGLAPVALGLAALGFAALVAALGAQILPYGGWLALPALAAALYVADLAWRGLNLEWLAKASACLVETARGEKPAWDERCAAFARRLSEVVSEGATEEIVVVGHSLGAVLAMMTVRRFLDLGPPPARPILFATLGNIVPFYTWVEPGGRWLREGAQVAQSRHVDWIDITSGSDPASACRMGPLVGSDASVPRWEPEFHNILTPERFRYIRRRPLDFHLQYLKPSDHAGGFDFIRMISSSEPFFAGAPR